MSASAPAEPEQQETSSSDAQSAVNGVRSDVTPDAPASAQPAIGLIGMGEMGRMYAAHLARAGWKKIHVCDRPEKYAKLREDYQNDPSITVHSDGHGVARTSDFILYSVEAEFIDQVVAQYGPSTKVGAIVGGQTSVKAPEKAAFEKYLPEDAQIVSCHSLHGPTVSPLGQPLVIIRHRASDAAQALVESILRPLRSRFVYLSYEDHDRVTANTQAVTHAAFLSMGTAWAAQQAYPWEHGYYVGGIETVKVNIMLRIYANKWHVYAGLAILNPSARVQIDQYAASTTELFKLMLAGDRAALRERLHAARQKVFVDGLGAQGSPPILLSEDVLDRFSLGKKPQPAGTALASPLSPSPSSPCVGNNANSHLSLLAMVDCWAALDLHPFVHLALAATPIFRLWIGVAEYLFRAPARLDAAIDAALRDVSHRADDLEFVVAARGWSQAVSFGSFELYRERFERTAAFFRPRFAESARLGGEMIRAILDSSNSSGDNGGGSGSGTGGTGSGARAGGPSDSEKIEPRPSKLADTAVVADARASPGADDAGGRETSPSAFDAPTLLSVPRPLREASEPRDIAAK